MTSNSSDDDNTSLSSLAMRFGAVLVITIVGVISISIILEYHAEFCYDGFRMYRYWDLPEGNYTYLECGFFLNPSDLDVVSTEDQLNMILNGSAVKKIHKCSEFVLGLGGCQGGRID